MNPRGAAILQRFYKELGGTERLIRQLARSHAAKKSQNQDSKFSRVSTAHAPNQGFPECGPGSSSISQGLAQTLGAGPSLGDRTT